MMIPGQQPIVSVIVPVYNTAACVGRCLDSLLAQTYANIEIICIDDGSTDDSLKVLQQYAQRDTRVKVLHQENAGVSAARNKGLSEATGEFLSFIDSDDWLDVSTYEKVIACFTNDVDMVSFGAYYVYDTLPLKEMGDRNKGDYEGELTAERLLYQQYWMNNKVVRRAFVERYQVRFPEDMVVAEDGTVALMLLSQVKKISHLAAPLCYYYQRSGSAMWQLNRKSYKVLDNLKMLERVWDFAQLHGMSDAFRLAIPYIFWMYYSAVIKLVPQDAMAQARQEGGRIAKKVHADKAEKCWGMFPLLEEKQGKWEKLFHWYTQNRECFGIGGKSICSIMHTPPYRIYSVLGKKLFKIRYRSVPV